MRVLGFPCRSDSMAPGFENSLPLSEMCIRDRLHIVDGKIFKIEEQHHDDTEEDTENEEER